jgi:hypothetical protein
MRPRLTVLPMCLLWSLKSPHPIKTLHRDILQGTKTRQAGLVVDLIYACDVKDTGIDMETIPYH